MLFELKELAKHLFFFDFFVARYVLSGAAQAFLDPSHGFDRITPDDLKNFVTTYLSGERMSRVDMLPAQESAEPVLEAV